MEKYRKREIIKVVEWTGDNYEEIEEFAGGEEWVYGVFTRSSGPGEKAPVRVLSVYVRTGMTSKSIVHLSPGDCLVKREGGTSESWAKEYLEYEYEKVQE